MAGQYSGYAGLNNMHQQVSFFVFSSTASFLRVLTSFYKFQSLSSVSSESSLLILKKKYFFFFLHRKRIAASGDQL